MSSSSLGVTRVANTARLITLNQKAITLGLNRQLDPDLREALDPNGYHVLKVVLPYHNGVEAIPLPHHRVELLVKVVGSIDPATALLDVAVNEWEQLPAAEEILAMVRQLDEDANAEG